jgi:hypothetical protein
VKAFSAYVQTLRRLINETVSCAKSPAAEAKLDAALDGQPSSELRRLVGLADQRAAGAFFTGSKLAARAVSRIMGSVNGRSLILDPACGAGDLLVACAKQLPSNESVRATIDTWSRQLLGFDLQKEFVRASKHRLVLTAVQRHLLSCQSPELFGPGPFPGIRTGCGLTATSTIGMATHILLNPPYTRTTAPADCKWATGTISSAALFVDTCLAHAAKGARIAAILPDALRSGPRYARWRDHVLSQATIDRVRLVGQFDRWADVDVFILDLSVSRQPTFRTNPWAFPRKTNTSVVSDFFNVSVGPVVPHRDSESGLRHRYIHARNVPAWGTLTRIKQTRCYPGRTHAGPFVVTRRTSRAGDKHRAVGTIIRSPGSVAVENHLLVLTPKDGTLGTCRRLLRVLSSQRTTNWINQRIRCRHLTVAVMRELPWWEDAT